MGYSPLRPRVRCIIKTIVKNLKILVLIFSVAFLSTGCATIFGGGSDEILTVESSEPLKIKLVGSDGQVINRTTPFTLDIDRSQNYTVKVQSDNYESQDVYVGKKVRVLAMFNLLCILCWAIDFATGNVWEHKMHYVYIDTADLDRKKAMGLKEFDSLISLQITGKDPDKEFAQSKISGKINFKKIGA